MFDRSFFPIFQNHPDLAYFDNAATTQTHGAVLDAMTKYYTEYRASPGRGEYDFVNKTGHAVDIARQQVADLINAPPENIIFTHGTTHGLNLVAKWNKHVKKVIISEAEHNANIVPWLEQGRSVKDGSLVVLPVDETGAIRLDEAEKILYRCPNSLLSINCVSNVTGVEQPWRNLVNIARSTNTLVCLDACQAVAHSEIDVSLSGASGWASPDWMVFSGHKMYGPTGVGVLYCKADLDMLRPLEFGGGAVNHVAFDKTEFASGYQKHEPGTPNTAGIIGIGVAAELIKYMGYEYIEAQESFATTRLIDMGLFDIPNLISVGDGEQAAWYSMFSSKSILSFYPTNCHSSDVATLLSDTGVAVRTGRLCAHPLVDKLTGGRGIVRISVAPYNTEEDCKKLIKTLSRVMLTLG